jgi:APA family basic amino acid/polyamine antiporter
MNNLAADQKRQLVRTLDWKQIAVSCVAICVGAGIFSVGAKVISQDAGPSSVLSFLIAGLVCALAAMCYAEFSSVIPIAGSAYTYSYTAVGEIFGWIIGWNIILELFLATTVIMKYWCVYLYDFFYFIGIGWLGPIQIGDFKVDWPIFIIAAAFVMLLIRGTELAAKTTTVLAVLKVAVVFIVIIMGVRYFDIANFTPFVPEAKPIDGDSGIFSQSLFSFILGQEPMHFGIFGILAGAGVIFFAFIGFDSAAGLAEETKNPRKNVPLGLMVGVAAVVILYILVAIVTCGMVPYTAFSDYQIDHPDMTASLTTAFAIHGDNVVGGIISVGIVIGLISVILVAMLSVSRVIFAMSRGGLLPRSLSITSKYKTPHRCIILVGILATAIAAFAYVSVLDNMISIGTLSAFILVSIAVPIYRKRTNYDKNNDLVVDQNGDKIKPFRVPFSPIFPIISAVVCFWLMLQLNIETWLAFGIWLVVGLAIYFGFGYRNSELNKHPEFIEKSSQRKEYNVES